MFSATVPRAVVYVSWVGQDTHIVSDGHHTLTHTAIHIQKLGPVLVASET